MKTYRFFIKLYRDVDAEDPREAKKRIDEMMETDRKEMNDSLENFVVIEGVHDNEPKEI